MTYTSDKELERIAKGVTECTLPKPDWTHGAHFAAALWMLSEPDRDTFAEMPNLIRAYNEATGVPNTDEDGYHETITLASLRAARHILINAPGGEALHQTLNRLLASAYGAPGWLLAYWSGDHLFSVEARRVWVEPNLAPLPFD